MKELDTSFFSARPYICGAQLVLILVSLPGQVALLNIFGGLLKSSLGTNFHIIGIAANVLGLVKK
jgi:hypothetical protein